MPENAAPAQPTPTIIPAPIAAGPQGAGALAEAPKKKEETPAENPFEFELDVKGQKQKLAFKDKSQLTAALQKALYADQVIKDGIQAKKGAEALISKMKAIGQGDTKSFYDLMKDPEIAGDAKKIAIAVVQEMMSEEEKYKGWSEEQIKLAERAKLADQYEAELKAQKEAEQKKAQQEKNNKLASETRASIIEAMKKYPDIPQTQATMDAVILNMRAAYQRFGKHLTAEQAMTVYSEQYWKSFGAILEKMEPQKILERFGSKALDKIQQLKLAELKQKTNPATQKNENPEIKKKKHLTEKEFEKHFQQLAGL